MAHNIETRSGRASIVYAGETPWHRLGQKVKEAFDARTALKQGGLDFTVEKVGIKTLDGATIFLQGDPGIGKSALLDYLVSRLPATKWTVSKFNGTQLRIETIEDYSRSLAYTDLFGGYRVLRIEEVDKANHMVQARMLTLLDDLPKQTAVLCSSNKDVGDLDERFQSRFQVFTLQAPATEEIQKLLKRFRLSKADINRIATFCCGNVRLALFDAQSAIDESLARGVERRAA